MRCLWVGGILLLGALQAAAAVPLHELSVADRIARWQAMSDAERAVAQTEMRAYIERLTAAERKALRTRLAQEGTRLRERDEARKAFEDARDRR